jgi:S-adenosylmethionine:tRNA ribosyltransferase-isomerase
VRTSELDYELPERLIAHHPAEERGASQLMIVDAHSGVRDVGRFDELLLNQLREDDLVVANNTRVLHARLPVTRPGGGEGELLLLEPVDATVWRSLARPARRLRPGMELATSTGRVLSCVEREADGHWLIDVGVTESEVPSWLAVDGLVPLPPYIAANGQDPARYQTTYATIEGSVAAPTAGLHFDDELWRAVSNRCEVATLTLHVGAGTFLPVRVDDLDEHDMHAERYEVPDSTDRALREALSNDRRIVAVGTTTTRVLESVYGASQLPTAGSTRLFMAPGYRFACVGALLTNFHLPRSTLLALVMAFAGEDTTRNAYQTAIERDMRFYSFGDAMFIHGASV